MNGLPARIPSPDTVDSCIRRFIQEDDRLEGAESVAEGVAGDRRLGSRLSSIHLDRQQPGSDVEVHDERRRVSEKVQLRRPRSRLGVPRNSGKPSGGQVSFYGASQSK